MSDQKLTHADKYTGITINVSNAQAGQNIEIKLGANSPPDASVAWSSGPSFATAAGMQLTSNGGALPLTQLNVTEHMLTFQTAAGGAGGALAFTLALYLAAHGDIATFYLTADADSGVQVTAATSGSMPQTINQGTILNWPTQ